MESTNSENVVGNSQNNEISDSVENNLEKEKNETSTPLIKVFDPIKKEGIKPYVVYSIKFPNDSENITFYRRYSDFFSLREKLVERWPGVYIPNIPPKKAINNLHAKIVEMRMKLLNKFCLKLSKFLTIFNSEEMKIFFTGGNSKSNTPIDIKKSLNGLPNQSYEELHLKYKRAFPDFYESFEINPTLNKIFEFQTFLKKSLQNLKNFKDVVQNSMNKKQQEIENYLSLINVFSDYEKYTLLEYSENDDKKLIFFNPNNSDLCMKLLKLVGLKNGN